MQGRRRKLHSAARRQGATRVICVCVCVCVPTFTCSVPMDVAVMMSEDGCQSPTRSTIRSSSSLSHAGSGAQPRRINDLTHTHTHTHTHPFSHLCHHECVPVCVLRGLRARARVCECLYT